ncbi:sarcosine oxidase subunit alpha family protein [Arhodomonas aquaeolei]|uniref:sarcosine oxidase subunit alpha family protein n=1 Tax=Arhodomonas aquaeolei TaxID=2369 RepID=UPI0021692787|nr:sarcosine oxidase subunit alpha family protein [Arhodomonas aquaeolei]MCS4505981.1 sarcosine oxidase subunit alpha family protein [Arhodomonas aquaeolei]
MNAIQDFRLPRGGAVNRDRPVTVTFDGREYSGYEGDTLASLLLANGVRLLGRSFKYHRPRGVLSIGSEEPNALVELRPGARREPNTRATTIEVFEGLTATSQNRFPSLKLDLLAANRLAQRFLVAGFYYKTFMWPAAFWEKVYEKRIRQAAGLGRAAGEPDPDHYEHAHAHADVVIAGAGPAGLMAALAAGRSGARVILLEERPWLGGRLCMEREELNGQPAIGWVAAAEAELEGMSNVRVLQRTTLTGAYDHTVLSALERVADHLAEPPPGTPRQRLWILRAQRVVLATGAFERPLVFDDNDLPGIMLASAVRGYLNRFAVAPGRRFVVATTNDDAYRTAFDLAASGLDVAAVLDARDDPGPAAEHARAQGIRVLTGALPGRARGGHALKAVDVVDHGGSALERIPCDCLAVSGGYTPDVSLISQTGLKPEWDEAIAAFVPGEGQQAYRCAGASAGAFDLKSCLHQGLTAGTEAVRLSGFTVIAEAQPPAVSTDSPAPLQPVWRVPGTGKAFVDYQNDVTAGDVELANREGFQSVEHLKRYTTLGMATDQGKTSNVNGLALLARAQGRPIPEVGTTRFRPPAGPVAIGAFAGHRRGRDFAPVRRTAMFRWHEAHGARYVDAGHWLRPSCYPRHGEDIAAALRREAATVRRAVGICDVSTLGKIDVFGTDAGEFLSRIYINGFRKLAVGRVRYGAMLRHDGHLLDDGTTSRLAEDHFVMTTTTANAARVLAHLEFHAQVAWPELDVAVCSATEQWATMAVAGPESRRTLQAALPHVDLSADSLPFMGLLTSDEGDFPVRVFRISFSGEMAYEVSVPWGYGWLMWERVMEAGAPHGITPYGTEALSVLRIEKGHAAGPEFDGRTSAHDIGLGGMFEAQKKDFVGRRLGSRPALTDPARPRMMGLQALGSRRLRGGAHLVADPARAGIDTSLGRISSVAYSPHVEAWIALGFVSGGEERLGETLYAVFPLYGETVPVRVCEPCFVDKEGGRLRD